MKAFDSVPHQRLLLKCQELGIAGKLVEWIRSFLTGRRQRVCVDGVMSEWIEITSGDTTRFSAWTPVCYFY